MTAHAPEVTFLSDLHANTKFMVSPDRKTTGRSAEGVPIVEVVGDESVAHFKNGSCRTSDPTVVAFLDLQPGVVRAEDPLASIKLQHGQETISKIEKALREREQMTLEDESYG